MKAIYSLTLAVVAASMVFGQDAPQPAEPTKEHLWLKQLAGEWTIAAEAMVEPGKPPLKCTGTESGKGLGDLWFVSHITNEMPGVKVSAQMTLGYDPEKKQFVGTWVDSMQNHMWHYVGSLDAAGKVLTLEAEGPSMQDPSKKAKYRDVIEIKSPDVRTLTGQVQGPDGKWVTFMTSTYTRKK
jgi:hypothetical protein